RANLVLSPSTHEKLMISRSGRVGAINLPGKRVPETACVPDTKTGRGRIACMLSGKHLPAFKRLGPYACGDYKAGHSRESHQACSSIRASAASEGQLSLVGPGGRPGVFPLEGLCRRPARMAATRSGADIPPSRVGSGLGCSQGSDLQNSTKRLK